MFIHLLTQSVFIFKLWGSSNEQGKADAPMGLCSSWGVDKEAKQMNK